MRRLSLAALLATLVAPAVPALAQGKPESGAFLVRLGTDTISVERFTRTATRLEGELATRSPRTVYLRYVADLGLNGSVTRFEATIPRPGAPADAPPQRQAVASFTGDSIRLEVRRGDTLQTLSLAVGAGAVPLLQGAFAPYELLIARSRQGRRDSTAVPTYLVGSQAPFTVVLRRLGRDSVLLLTQFTPFRAKVDRDGRILGLHAPGTTQQVLLERLPSLDVATVAAGWAARDAQGQAMGTLSPRDTVRATVGGASLLVDYGRPRKRGREIFGNVVPWGQVWRTGANAATQFRTDRDLVLGTLDVPAGTYTLWTLPTGSGWQLIVNRQTRQWGTEYDPARDLGRVAMTVSALAEPVEVFTIGIEARGSGGGALTVSWDRTKALVPFTVR
jgi:hypothetical protein